MKPNPNKVIIRPGKVRRLRAVYELARAAPEGCLVEVGVLAGSSARFLHKAAEEQGRELFLYDTFEGHPWADPIDKDKKGDRVFGNVDYIKELCPEAHVVKGIFPDSKIEMPPVAFAHIDVDQYQSYKLAIETLRPLMVPGGMMYFDDWRHHPGCRKAIREAFGEEDFGYIPNLFRAYKIFGEPSELQSRALDWVETVTKREIIDDGVTLGDLGFEPLTPEEKKKKNKKARKHA